MTRDAAAIGAGLDPVRSPRTIRLGERIHVVGAAGAGASAAALLASAAGADVTACDAGGASPYSRAFDSAGLVLEPEHDPRHVRTSPRPERLAVTKALTAIDPDHPELRAARELGIAVEPWQQLIADAAADKTLVAVAGTHGKSTTAGWLVHVLAEAGLDPSAFVGALLPPASKDGAAATARTGEGTVFVVEADEYAGNFDAYRPAIAILTSAEWDHPDVFADAAAVRGSFARWLAAMPDGGVVIANVGDPGVRAVLAVLDAGIARPRTVVRVMLENDPATPSADATLVGRVVDTDTTGTTLVVHGAGGDPGDDADPVVIRLATFGRHNAENALGVIGAALALDVPIDALVRGLETFSGVGRRLERKGDAAGVVVYDDYGHHPTAIRATISALRQREPGRRVWAVYEPLTYHRTAALLPAFAEALATADAVAIADIWAGRDPDTTVTSAAALATAIAAVRADIPVEAPGSVEMTADWLAGQVLPGDAVLVMGGGRSYQIGERLLERIGGTSAR